MSDFRRDLGPTTLRILYGLALTSAVTALAGVAIRVAGAPAKVWLSAASGTALFASAVALGAWLQLRRAPARMYRYSRDLSIYVRSLFDTRPIESAQKVAALLSELRSSFERELHHVVVIPALLVGTDDGGLMVQYTASQGELAVGQRFPAGRCSEVLTRDDMIREDNLRRSVAKHRAPPDLVTLHSSGFLALRAAPVKRGEATIGVLVIAAKKKGCFSAGDDRLILVGRGLLGALVPGEGS